ncbi:MULTISPECIES: site-specific integrase [unclassified Saccharopolyspora]|uniref:tyrosine-type recombinase/integrase n=1 Tax=unclassified Saccharopolyspora TaxID=2646250 RepID=UPI001CD7EDA0|nr:MULTISPECIES: site-specific integrase [unclassified Saccharopolyspora]MCA1186169.1 site-specific integrase [Saccharopolyspora sp. 6T]MCA1278372.1 site-specific integrase [Saccharopolyspora sp. 7B]
MDIDPSGLIGEAGAGDERPTFAEYLPKVEKAVSESSARVYAPYWRRLIQAWGGRRLDEPSASEIKQLAWRMKEEAVARRNTRGGRSAAEHFVGAVRCIYSHAESDGLIDEAKNPARRVAKPRRLPSTRRALPSSRIAELNKVSSTTGNDPDLDALLLRLHMETACRRGGALAVRPRDLDVDQCLVLLREKGETVRWQPVSPTLMRALQEHARARGDDDPDGQLLRYVGGAPISRRRYDHLWHRLGRHLPWVAAQQITTHWLRHTTLTWVERHFGYAVAREFAGHAIGSGDGGATATYVRADLHEVATALAALTGEPHPLAGARR